MTAPLTLPASRARDNLSAEIAACTRLIRTMHTTWIAYRTWAREVPARRDYYLRLAALERKEVWWWIHRTKRERAQLREIEERERMAA